MAHLPKFTARSGEVFWGSTWLPRPNAERLLALYAEETDPWARGREAALQAAMNEAYHEEEPAA